MLIELGAIAPRVEGDVRQKPEDVAGDLPGLLQTGRRAEVEHWLQQRYQLDRGKAKAVARLLTHGLPVLVQDAGRRWLTFCLSQGPEALEQHTLLEGMRSLTVVGRSADAAEWYGVAFGAAEDLSWEAVLLLGGIRPKPGEPSEARRRRQRSESLRPRLLALLVVMALVSLVLGIAIAMLLS